MRGASSNHGAALFELTCAIFIVTVGVFGALQMQLHTMDKLHALQDYAVAERVLSNEIETLRAMQFDALAPGAGLPLRSDTPLLAKLEEATASVDILPHDDLPGLWEVRVHVTWTIEHRRRVTKEVTTLIARRDEV